MSRSQNARWTHQSVIPLTKEGDPVEVISNRARDVVMKALNKGWSGPPYDIMSLARLLGYQITPREDIAEASVVRRENRKKLIQYNPHKPKRRVRFSIAHEIAHTLFEDWHREARYRQTTESFAYDHWQLEMLCNIAAAELLMPTSDFGDFNFGTFGIHEAVQIAKEYEVSLEALLIRFARLASCNLYVFAASPKSPQLKPRGYRFDYLLSSETGYSSNVLGTSLPAESVVHNCTAISWTDKGSEDWPRGIGPVDVECIGAPAYPGHLLPRVVGIARPRHNSESGRYLLKYVRGNALEPHGNNSRLLVHVINDRARSWGKGFGLSMSKAYPEVLENFQNATSTQRQKLGDVFSTTVNNSLTVVSIVAQRGYGEPGKPRLDYRQLDSALEKVAEIAKRSDSTVHMPRIGTGHAGGLWSLIVEIVKCRLCQNGVPVTVYDLPVSATPLESSQQYLF